MKTKLLLDTINSVLPGTTNKGFVEGSNMIVIMNGELIAYNDRVSVSTFIDDPGLDIECAINAIDFKNVIKGIKEEDIDLSMADNILSIVSEKTEAEIPVTSEVSTILSLIKALNLNELKFETLPTDFNAGLKHTVFNVSDDYSDQNNLFCLCIKDDLLYASDDFRLSRYKMNSSTTLNNCLIPKNNLENLISFQAVGVTIASGWAHFLDAEDSIFSCRTVSGNYPITEKIFDSFVGNTSILLPEELKNTLDDITPLYDEVMASHKGVKLEIKNDYLYCEIEKEKVWVKKKLELPNKGDPNISFMLSSVFLTEILGWTNVIHVNDRQAIFESDNFKHVILLQLEET